MAARTQKKWGPEGWVPEVWGPESCWPEGLGPKGWWPEGWGPKGGGKKGVGPKGGGPKGWDPKGGGLKGGAQRVGARRVGARRVAQTCPKAAGVSHDNQRAQTCTFEGPGLQKHHQNSTRRAVADFGQSNLSIFGQPIWPANFGQSIFGQSFL